MAHNRKIIKNEQVKVSNAFNQFNHNFRSLTEIKVFLIENRSVGCGGKGRRKNLGQSGFESPC